MPHSALRRRWYPVIDYDRCTNCMECIDFCLFGVYGVDGRGRILVEEQDNCKKGCPACSRVCPPRSPGFAKSRGSGGTSRLKRRVERAIRRGFEYLDSTQRADGSWLPLWFGNQFHHAEENPTYGTARVLAAYRDAGRLDSPSAGRGLEWLRDSQNADGGWGGSGVRSLESPSTLGFPALKRPRWRSNRWSQPIPGVKRRAVACRGCWTPSKTARFERHPP